MKEQDFIDTINHKTKDIPIPDSISPEAMKQMLDEHMKDTKNLSPAAQDTQPDTNTKKPNRNRNIRRFTAAACIVLCLAGSIGVSKLLTLTTGNSKDADYVMEAGQDCAAEDSVAEMASEEETDLTSSTSLQSPSSYSDYYETIKTAYDEYYSNLADVETRAYSVDDVSIMEESAVATSDVAPDTLENSSSMSRLQKESAVSETAEATTASKDDFSSTNTQEKNIDEGDIIKTDGEYIYKVISSYNENTSYTDYTLTITKADNGNLTSMSTITLNDLFERNSDIYTLFHEFYLYQDQLFLMYSMEDYRSETMSTQTYIVVYDISNKKEPKKVTTLSQSGWYVSSRISDGYLYTISNFSDTSLETEEPYSNYIPSINGKTINCNDIYYPIDVMMETTYVVTSLPLDNPTDFTDTKAIPTRGGETYVSDSAIYFYCTLYEKVNKTEITKVRYDNGKLTPGNTATVTGYLYDSFALNEHKNHLRIVATIPANNISLLRFSMDDVAQTTDTTEETVQEDVNVLYILDDNMELTGKISGIAPGEQIYSARFMGDIGYFVTYRNTDPLFSVDLSDTSNPKIIGQLKIPGFSNYLHFYDDNLLFGFGSEINAETQEFTGLKLSMFDISDPANVTEQDKYVMEDALFSPALYNHKTLMIDTEKNIFGFMYYVSSNTEASDWDAPDAYYYATYCYDKQNGFVETAKYVLNDGSEYENDSVRGLYIGDYFYLATNKSITSYEIGSTEPIAQVYFK